jgi:putative membrane protein
MISDSRSTDDEDRRPVPSDRRWPGWVYAGGSEPDVRFTFANERTFLAWIRTALALMAAGVVMDEVQLSISERVQHSLAILLLTLGFLCSVSSWLRWSRLERAMRRGHSLPAANSSIVLSVGVAVVAVVLIVSLFR